ncbi:MAG TPA: class A beta-lactamase [Gammaproteobacteria bacterium]|nr:class A beta-lactamase [Gammaproteobacteria bacterium]
MKSYPIKFLIFLILTFLYSYPLASFANITKTEALLINKKIEALENSLDGRIGIYALNTANNQSIQYRALERFPIQSTFKIMVVSAILKKNSTDNQLLRKKITYTNEDLVFWSPITEKNINSGMTISELCAAAMMYSDNTATNLIMKELGGPAAVTAFARSIGDTSFYVSNWEPELNSNPNNATDISTPKAMAKAVEKLALEETLLVPQREKLVAWMKGNTTGATRIRAGVPKGWVVADKTGSGDFGISNDIAVIWPRDCAPIIVSIYSIQNKKEAARHDEILVSSTQLVINEFSKNDSCLKLIKAYGFI